VFLILSITARSSELKVVVDSRIELLSAVQLLGKYGKKFTTDLDFPYKSRMEKYFNHYKQHKVVAFLDKLCREGFSYDAPPNLLLHLTEPPELKIEIELSEYLKGRSNKKNLIRLIELLRDFAKKSDFMCFFKSNKEFYKGIEKRIKNKTKELKIVKRLENYYRLKQNSYTIIPAPILSGNYGPRLKNKNYKYNIYDITGPKQYKNNVLDFILGDMFEYITLHEFSHSFINPLGEKFKKELNKYNHLLNPIKDRMASQAYRDWITVVNEHIVRAVTARLYYNQRGYDSGFGSTDYEILFSGVIYIKPLFKKLAEYENQRNKYSKFSDFYPELIKVFKNISEKTNNN